MTWERDSSGDVFDVLVETEEVERSSTFNVPDSSASCVQSLGCFPIAL